MQPRPATDCDGSCVDLATDQDNCGSCDNRCEGGRSCSAGKCTCQPDEVWGCGTGGGPYGARCVNFLSTSDCGQCGAVCATAMTCDGGRCRCLPPAELCDGICKDLSINPYSCGSCGNACAADQVCSQGTCAASCATGLTSCYSSCVDLQVTHRHCGQCWNACQAAEICVGGECVPL